MRRRHTTSFTLVLLLAAWMAAAARGVPPMSAQPDDDTLYVVVPRDAIRAIDDPEFEPAEEADRHIADNDIIIGLVGEHEQRAYSTWHLDRHEIVNDVFEGRPVAVTW